jgi:hypothetical protein
MPPRRIGRESEQDPYKSSTSPMATTPSFKRKNPKPKQKSKATLSAMLEITRFTRTYHLLIPRLSFARVVKLLFFENQG